MTGKTNVSDAIKEIMEYWRFERFIASGLAKFVWQLQVLLGIAWLFAGNGFGFLIRLLVVFLWLVVSRLLAEFFIVQFRIADSLREISQSHRESLKASDIS